MFKINKYLMTYVNKLVAHRKRVYGLTNLA